VHINGYCGGCRYHNFPYEAQSPLRVKNKYPVLEFKSDKDVWNVIDKLIKEAYETKAKGRDIDVAYSIYRQLPFFTCTNIVLENEYQKDIKKYLYCKEFGVHAYSGSYGEQPAKWIEKVFIIKSALAVKERNEIKEQEKKIKKNG
jgi:hypothetical protein|tara:strand:+ start:493 stop:927 length:435 start_codon:yes stop_codon:yes gene_type:complete